MTHRPESSWNPPSIDRILFHFDGIYASGVFCMVVSPQLLDSQSRLMSAIALMAEKLRATLHPQDQSLLESRRRRYAPLLNCQNTSFIFSPFTDSLRHVHRRKRNKTHLSCDTNTNDASTQRRQSGSGSDHLSILNPQLRISLLCTIS